MRVCRPERPEVARQLTCPVRTEGSGEPRRGAPVGQGDLRGCPSGSVPLPSAGRPRRLGPDEAAALKARPWPRLPWWLWLAVAVTTVAMVVVAAGLFGRPPTSSRSRPGARPRPRT